MNKIILGKQDEDPQVFYHKRDLNLLFSFVSIVVKEFIVIIYQERFSESGSPQKEQKGTKALIASFPAILAHEVKKN